MRNDQERSARGRAARLGVILGLCAAGAWAEIPGPTETPINNESSTAVQTPESTIRNWPDRSRSTALAMIAKYGEPDRFTDEDLVWNGNGPWRKTIVYREAPQGLLRGNDILEQSIDYSMPEGKIEALKSFDSRIKFDKTTGELSSREESESRNYLALNLADEVVSGKRDPDEARDFYRRTARLAESGKSSPYMEGFLFPLKQQERSNPNAEPAPTEEPYKSGMPDRVRRPGDIMTPTTPPYP